MNATLSRITARTAPSPAGLVPRLLQTLLTWQERAHQRYALQQLNGRDLRDLGLSQADIAFEARKPFWRG